MNEKLGTCTSGEVHRQAGYIRREQPCVAVVNGERHAVTKVRVIAGTAGPLLSIDVGERWEPPARAEPAAETQPAEPEPGGDPADDD